MMYRYHVRCAWNGRNEMSFPHDMLRYDQAKIENVFMDDGKNTYVIVGKTKPTVGRWNSFLFNVSNVEVVK